MWKNVPPKTLAINMFNIYYAVQYFIILYYFLLPRMISLQFAPNIFIVPSVSWQQQQITSQTQCEICSVGKGREEKGMEGRKRTGTAYRLYAANVPDTFIICA